MGGATVEAKGLYKSFGDVVAVRDVDLHVESGRIAVLLGPSGCGKSTLLKLVAGIYRPDRGRIYINGLDVTDVPPYKRDVAIVFQDLALFPHMDVYDNVAFGLRMRRVPEGEVKERVYEALSMMRLDPHTYARRRITELSGGQQQRVALARALVLEPSVLLLDEPFSHVDLKVKLELLEELRRLHARLGLTVMYVTHDQFEAMEVADEVMVMKDGRILQAGPPRDVYRRPADPFVASFFGEANVFRAESLGLGFRGYVVLRPENVKLGGGSVRVRGVVEDVTFMGPYVKVEVSVDGAVVKVYGNGGLADLRRGTEVEVGWDESDMIVFRE